MAAFVTTRADGRTNAEVILAVIEGAEPGALVPFETFAAALSVGSSRSWDRAAVQSAVRQASRRILTMTARALIAVRGVGYRISVGSDHHALALRREARASVQLRGALDVLKHAQYAEMSSEQRTIHEAHLTITGALFGQVQLVTRRQKRQEDAIQALVARVDRLEG